MRQKKQLQLSLASGIHSFQTIANEMNKLGLRNAEGNPINPSRIEITLKNPFYFEVMCVKGELFPHKYPPIISEYLYDQAQAIMAGHNKAPVHYSGHPILFRGLITCDIVDVLSLAILRNRNIHIIAVIIQNIHVKKFGSEKRYCLDLLWNTLKGFSYRML